uniref:Uncharacterized protein n=1 Tax=Arundo donax TaxID=35708 RepID=A0A0A9ELI5_ARUDO
MLDSSCSVFTCRMQVSSADRKPCDRSLSTHRATAPVLSL